MWVVVIYYPHSYPHYKHGFYRILANGCGLYFAAKPMLQGVQRVLLDAGGFSYGGHRFRQFDSLDLLAHMAKFCLTVWLRTTPSKKTPEHFFVQGLFHTQQA
jgi:hypothetical protein